ncbi:hypothetical protein OAL44_00660 [Planctomycetaceae bacterium]|nr:hypothetical protein [Planctomycetaceae bacterium]
MKFGKGKDKSTVIYNEYIIVKEIPLEAYDYVVNGKPVIEWVMERQAVTTDKKAASSTRRTCGRPKRWRTPPIHCNSSCG